MGWIASDVRYGLRVLRKSPGFTLVAGFVLALGIGANTTIFSVADAFLFKPLPFRDLDRLASVMEVRAGLNDDWSGAAPANYLDWRQQARSFEAMAAYDTEQVSLTGAGDPELLEATMVSREFFPLLGIEPMLGRRFLPEENQPGRDRVVVLSRGLWQRRFGADPKIAGTKVKIDGQDCTVAGVMPKQFLFPMGTDLWMPLALDAQRMSDRTKRSVRVFARLKPSVSLREARAELQTISRQLADAYPNTNRGWTTKVAPMRETVVGSITRQYTFLLLGAVGFVLLIACANVANLQFVRASARVKEVAVRAALGGSRWRIVRQLLTESVILALMGAAGGLVLGAWGIRLVLAYMPPDIARWIAGWNEISLDMRAFAVTVAASVAAGVLSGLAPAIQASRPNLNETLKESGRTSASRSRQRLRGALVVGEIALALVLLIGAGLTVKGLRALVDLNQGFEPASLLTLHLTLPESRYAQPHQGAAFYDSILPRIGSIPGVRSAAIVSSVPFSPAGWQEAEVSIEGRPPLDTSERREAQVQVISPDYFRTLRIPVRDGRTFSGRDSSDSQRVAVVSSNFARRYWPGENPLGRRLQFTSGPDREKSLTVVGVVADVRQHWIMREPRPTVYVPYSQSPRGYTGVAVRTYGDPSQFVRAVKAQIASVDPDQPVYEVKSLETVIAQSTIGLAYVAVMMGVLGGIALLLSAVGIYAVMSFSVTERTHEIGVRVALGAGRGAIMRMVLARGALLAAAGLGIGLPLAFGLARMLAGILYGVNSNDPAPFAALSLTLAVVAMLACYVPGRRAVRIAPIRALRTE